MPERRDTPRCSCCGTRPSDVRRVVAGPGIYICDQCVYLCEEILKEDAITNDKSTTERMSALHAEVQRLHGLLRLESQLVKDLREEKERLMDAHKAGSHPGRN